MMRRLGRKVLKHLGAGFRSAKYITSLEDIDFASTDRVLFTFSYLIHQKALKRADINDWASLIKRAVDEVDQEVELIYTTANRSEGAHLDIWEILEQAKILRKQHPINVEVHRRFPLPTGRDGRIRWEEQSHLWKVRAEHWVLST